MKTILKLIFKNNLIELLTPDIKLAIIDMPVGLDKNPQKGGRLVDKEARKILDLENQVSLMLHAELF